MMNMIKKLREQYGMSQSELAEAAGTSQPQIKRLENGERKLTKEWADRLSGPLHASPEVLLFGWPDDDSKQRPEQSATIGSVFDLPNAKILDKIIGQGRMIPVFGQAVGGVDGEFEMNGNILYEVMAPPVLSHISNAYGVCVSGDSMAPRYEDGEICFIDPSRRVRKGDYVVAQVRLEEEGPLLAFVKKFCRHNASELVLEQFNPPKELRFDARTVVSVHYIALAGNA